MAVFDITVQIAKILDDYEKETIEASEEAAKEAAKFTAQQLKQSSPVKTGSYAKGWSSKQTGKGMTPGYTVYNKTDYQLTHLLEHGHVIRNGSGTFGRVAAVPHIAAAAESGGEEFERLIREKVGGIS